MTSSGSGTLGGSDNSDGPAISMDIYEEAPPPVAERWRFITGGPGSGRSTVRFLPVVPTMLTNAISHVVATPSFDPP